MGSHEDRELQNFDSVRNNAQQEKTIISNIPWNTVNRHDSSIQQKSWENNFCQ